MRLHLRHVRTIAVAAAIASLISGCSSADDWSRPHPDPTSIGKLGTGFVDHPLPIAPESTITPKPGSWEDVHPSKDYRVVLLTAGKDPQTKTLVKAVSSWAKDEKVSLKTITAGKSADLIPDIQKALKLAPDLIISAGSDLIDPLTTVTANHLDQLFLVIGAELAEPTHNVTAADWKGASFRGEGLGTSSAYDPASFTAERAARAVRAGVAAVLNDLTGIVIWLS